MNSIKKYTLSSLFVGLLMAWMMPLSLKAQDSIVEKQKAYITMKYVNTEGEARVHINVYTKQGRKREPVEFCVVNLYLDSISKLGMMGNITTDENGDGSVLLAEKFISMSDTMTTFKFIGSLMNDPRLKLTQKKLTVKPATLELSLYEEDSVRYAKAVLMEKGPNNEKIPVYDAEISFYVQRYFSLLPIAEYPSYTEENGEAIFKFPSGLAGDSAGNLIIVAKLNAHDDYGTLIASGEQQWGNPAIIEKSEERLLSGSRKNAPLFLIIVSNVIIIGVWSVIIYIIFKLFKLKSFNKQKNKNHEKVS